jgi:hypothetical protein
VKHGCKRRAVHQPRHRINIRALASEEAVTSLLFGFGALGVYSTGAAEVAKAPWYARGIIRGGPAAVESLLNGPAATHGG